MSKNKLTYVCSACGVTHPKWNGQCSDCSAWNTLTEEIVPVGLKSTHTRLAGYTGANSSCITKISEVALAEEERWSTELSELNRVLGGGLVTGSVVLIGGDPGIGKSTLLLQTLCQLSQQHNALYVTGEESLQQVTLRARRLIYPVSI